MDIKKSLQEAFSEVRDAFFENESGSRFLRVEVAPRTLDGVVALTKKISLFLDNIAIDDNNYLLDVYSAGTEQVIATSDLSNYLNANILVTLKIPLNNYLTFEGALLAVDDTQIIVCWNAKGQIRRQAIMRDIIATIKLSARA